VNPLFISRVGQDARGKEIQNRMKNWGINRAGLQIDPKHPTGVVSVQMDAGEPHFIILPDQAYDYIDKKGAEKFVEDDSGFFLYHGTLALRNQISCSTLKALVHDKKVKVFLDVNLREPWWSKSTVVESLEQATWLKCNTDEIHLIASLAHLKAQTDEEIAFALYKKYNLDKIFITKGAQGAMVMCGKDTIHSSQPAPVAQLIDTVGAGDGFSAVSILGLISGWEDSVLLERAVRFASEICQIQGATITEAAMYKNIKESWF
jgi:fructokinase